MAPIQAEEVNGTDNDIDEVNTTSIKTYTDLNNIINETQDGSTLNLSGSYKYNASYDNESLIDGIVISKNLTVVGKNNASIDGDYIARGLFINTSCSVILENITFLNGYSESSGAAIFLSDNCNLTLKNCTFKNNKVYNSNGGAVAGQNSVNIEVYACGFYNNTSIRVSDLAWKEDKKGMGSAIFVHLNSTLSLYDSVFAGNNAYLTTILVVSYVEDTKVINTSILYVKNCLFENNTSYSSGVFYLDEFTQGQITDSIFRKNVVTNTSSAIILDASAPVLIKNCLFEENSGIRGGAIHIKVFDYTYKSYVTISDCNFTNNTASEYGGAIFSKYGITNITNCIFTNNTAKQYGGAIFTKLGELTVSNSYFDGNSAQYGGALFIRDDKCSVDTSTFINNFASVRGGAVYSKIQNVSSSDCSYITNSAPVGQDVYGAFIGKVTKIYSYFEDVELKIKITSLWNMPLSQKIKLKFVGSKNYKTGWLTTSSNGELTLKVPLNIKAGTYTLKILMENGVCYSNPATIKVAKAPVKLELSKITTTFKSGKKFNIRVKNTKTNKYVPNAKLTIKVYTGKTYKTYTLTTNAKGLVKLSTSKIGVGTHSVVITAANKNIKLSKVKTSIKIKKASAILEVAKKVKRPSKIKIKVKNKASGKVIKNTKFKVRVYTGKHYKQSKIKTNSNGNLKISTKKLSKRNHKIAVILKNTKYKINKKVTVKVK